MRSCSGKLRAEWHRSILKNRCYLPHYDGFLATHAIPHLQQNFSVELEPSFQALAVAAEADPPGLLSVGRTELGRGLVVTEAVSERKTLLSIPLSNALVVTDEALEGLSVFGDKCHQTFQERHGELPETLLAFLTGPERWDVRMTAFLLWTLKLHRTEIGNQRHTRVWDEYRKSLPTGQETTCLLSFTNCKEVEALQLLNLQAEAREQREWIAYVHKKCFDSKSGELRHLGLVESPLDTFWAASMVRTRTFSETVNGEGVTLMVPFADLANHSFSNNSTFCMSKDKTRFELRSLGGDIPSGSEALISYGENKPNSELLRDYGFVVPGNPNDRLKLSKDDSSLPRINAESLMIASGLAGDWKQKGQFSFIDSVVFLRGPSEGMSRTELERMRASILSLPLSDGFNVQSDGGGRGLFSSWIPKSWTKSGEPPPRTLPVCEAPRELQNVRQLKAILEGMRSSLPSTSEEDELLLSGMASINDSGETGHPMGHPSMSRMRTAIQARLEHKLVLRSGIECLRKYEESLLRIQT